MRRPTRRPDAGVPRSRRAGSVARPPGREEASPNAVEVEHLARWGRAPIQARGGSSRSRPRSRPHRPRTSELLGPPPDTEAERQRPPES
jgi:hypothetical protein